MSNQDISTRVPLDDGIDTSQGYGTTEMSELTPLKTLKDIEAPPKVSWNRPYLCKATATEQQILDYDLYKGTWRFKLLTFLETYTKCDYLKQNPVLMQLSLYYQMLMVVLVLVSTASFIASTEPQFYHTPPLWSTSIDIFTVVMFVLDYVVRLGCCYSIYRYIVYLYNIFDLLSFLPLIVEWIVLATSGQKSSALALLRFFRLLRVFRLLKLFRFSPTLHVAIKSLKTSTEGFMLLVQIILVNLVFFSTTMYFVEGAECFFDYNEKLWKYTFDNSTSQFQSIVGTFWWNIVSVTTVGYGDVVPKTSWGRFVASIALISGIILLSFPIAIFGTNFHLLFSKQRDKLTGKVDKDCNDIDKKIDFLDERLTALEKKLDRILDRLPRNNLSFSRG